MWKENTAENLIRSDYSLFSISFNSSLITSSLLPWICSRQPGMSAAVKNLGHLIDINFPFWAQTDLVQAWFGLADEQSDLSARIATL